ncbi:MAG: CDP-alcohol phosphatidyltransferase family protein [Gemmatimonadota bacterium]|nr:CDP-alcohol phosphatidyltransferase family protein [Gemmatimonadota bacterium]
MSVRRILSVPNLLSLSRFPMAAAFVVAGSPARIALCVGASATDLLDGWLARRSGPTRWGALLDPVADKTFVLAALSSFLLDGSLSTTQYFIVLARDLASAVGFLVAYLMPTLDPASFKARASGKIVTVLQLSLILVVLLSPGWAATLVVLIGIFSLLSIADYTLVLHRQRQAARAAVTR